jgi:hypothetical protein
MPLNITGRLLCAAQQSYAINGAGPAPPSPSGPNDPTPLPSDLVGWTAQPNAWADGVGKIDAAMVGETASEIIVAFRGTEPFDSPDPGSMALDWLNDLNVPLVNDPNYPGASVHQGFRDALDALWPNVWPDIQARTAASPAKQLYLTGHSKGGPLANLAAFRCQAAGLKPYVCTFAGARPGDQAFANAYNAAVPHSSRYEYADDLVPHLPPEDSFLAGLIAKAPLLGQPAAQLITGYVSVGFLVYYATASSTPQADSHQLQGQRLGSLTLKVLTGQFGRIMDDHSLAPTYGYASAICPGVWTPLPWV